MDVDDKAIPGTETEDDKAFDAYLREIANDRDRLAGLYNAFRGLGRTVSGWNERKMKDVYDRLAALDDAFAKSLKGEADDPRNQRMNTDFTGSVPQEVLLNILRFLKPPDLGKALLVARRWSVPEMLEGLSAIYFGSMEVETDAEGLEEIVAQARTVVPYRNKLQLTVATRNLVKPGHFLNLAWQEYAKSSNPTNAHVGAIMYTIRGMAEKDYWLGINQTTTTDMVARGAIYSPWGPNPKSGEREMQHNMAVNKIWFLGVIHSGRNITLVTRLNDTSLTRGYSAHPHVTEKTGVSALGREALAATSTGPHSKESFYLPQPPETLPLDTEFFAEDPTLVIQQFIRNPSALQATLDDITYADTMTAVEAKGILSRRGVHVTDERGFSDLLFKNALLLWQQKQKIIEALRANQQHLREPDFLRQFGRYVRTQSRYWTDEKLQAIIDKHFPASS